MNSHCRLSARLALLRSAAYCTSLPAAMNRLPRLKRLVFVWLEEGGTVSE